MKILFLSHSSFAGGAERCLCMLLAGLPREKYESLALLPPKGILRRRGKGDITKTIKNMGVRTKRASLRWWVGDWTRYEPFARGLDKRVRNIARIIQREQVQLVLSNSCVVVEGALAANRCGVPHLWYVHEMLARDPVLNPFLPPERFYTLLSTLSSKVVVVSRSVKAEIEQFGPAPKVEVLHTGIPAIVSSSFKDPKKKLFDYGADTPVVTFVGLLSRRKGVLDLIDAAGLVLADFPRARFVLAGGDGGEAREASRRVETLGIQHAVQLLGVRSDVPDILAASDVFVLPALADPLPLAVLEAMSVGLPVVATRSGGCEEMVLDNETGRLVPVADPKALAAAILAMLKDPSRREEMGSRGRQHFQTHFSRQRYLRGFQRIIDTAAASTPGTTDDRGRKLETLQNELKQAATKQARQRRGKASRTQRAIEILRLLSMVR